MSQYNRYNRNVRILSNTDKKKTLRKENCFVPHNEVQAVIKIPPPFRNCQ
jgi:hypothetical protein